MNKNKKTLDETIVEVVQEIRFNNMKHKIEDLQNEILDLKAKLEKEKMKNNEKNRRVEEILFCSQLDENYNKILHKKILDAIFDCAK